jgi:uncharacterized SAM-binding protein YcdF (DUF218 family)
MDLTFVARLILRAWLLPPALPLLVALAGLWLARRRPRLGLSVAAAGVLALVALALPIVADPLQRAAEAYPPLDLTRPVDAGAIVVLGGGVRAGPTRDRPDEPTKGTLERLAHAVEVARATGLPMLLSGGTALGGTPEAATMQHALRRYFDSPAQWLEVRSRTTGENAHYSAELLREAGIRRVVLVTSALHMRRSVAQFEAAGLAVVPAPAGGTATQYGGWVDWLLPSIGSLERSCQAIHELVGVLVTVPRTGEAIVR